MTKATTTQQNTRTSKLQTGIPPKKKSPSFKTGAPEGCGGKSQWNRMQKLKVKFEMQKEGPKHLTSSQCLLARLRSQRSRQRL